MLVRSAPDHAPVEIQRMIVGNHEDTKTAAKDVRASHLNLDEMSEATSLKRMTYEHPRQLRGSPCTGCHIRQVLSVTVADITGMAGCRGRQEHLRGQNSIQANPVGVVIQSSHRWNIGSGGRRRPACATRMLPKESCPRQGSV